MWYCIFLKGHEQQYLHFICISDDVILTLLPSEWSEHTILWPTEQSGRDAMWLPRIAYRKDKDMASTWLSFGMFKIGIQSPYYKEAQGTEATCGYFVWKLQLMSQPTVNINHQTQERVSLQKTPAPSLQAAPAAAKCNQPQNEACPNYGLKNKINVVIVLSHSFGVTYYTVIATGTCTVYVKILSLEGRCTFTKT